MGLFSMLSSLRDTFYWLKALRDHRRTLKLSRAELEAVQLRRFRRLVAFARAHSPYWQRVIAKHGIDPGGCVPTDFPVLTKGDIIEHFDEMVTDRRITKKALLDHLAGGVGERELFLGEYHVIYSSGTSGTAHYQLYSRRDWIRGASLVTRMMPPFRLRQRSVYVASIHPNSTGARLVRSGNRGLNRLLFDVRLLDACLPLREIVDRVNRIQPHSLAGYAKIVTQLAEAQLRGELKIRPTHVSTGGEMLTDEARAKIERAFGTAVHSTYASTEHLYMGLTLPPDGGMHLMEDEFMFELHADHTCVTNLYGTALPLIRHRMNDILVAEDARDENPRPFRRVQQVIGRMENALVFANDDGEEDFIHPILLEDFLAPNLESWQIVHASPACVKMRLVFKRGLSNEACGLEMEDLKQQMQRLLAEKRMNRVRVEADRVDELPIDPVSRKFRLVVKE